MGILIDEILNNGEIGSLKEMEKLLNWIGGNLINDEEMVLLKEIYELFVEGYIFCIDNLIDATYDLIRHYIYTKNKQVIELDIILLSIIIFDEGIFYYDTINGKFAVDGFDINRLRKSPDLRSDLEKERDRKREKRRVRQELKEKYFSCDSEFSGVIVNSKERINSLPIISCRDCIFSCKDKNVICCDKFILRAI